LENYIKIYLGFKNIYLPGNESLSNCNENWVSGSKFSVIFLNYMKNINLILLNLN